MLRVASKTSGLCHFIYCSTAYVGWGKEGFSDEEARCWPETEYERTKYGGEREVVAWMKKGKFPITIVRPGMIYGRHGDGLVPFFKLIKTGHFFFVGKGEHLFEMTHVDDVVGAFEAVLLNKKTFGETFIISEEQPKTFREVVEMSAEIMAVPMPRRRIPKVVFRIAAEGMTMIGKVLPLPIPFTKDTYKTLAVDRAFNTSKAKKLLKYKPKVALAKGLEDLIGWYTKNGWL